MGDTMCLRLGADLVMDISLHRRWWLMLRVLLFHLRWSTAEMQIDH